MSDGDKRSVYPLENKHFTHKRGGKHVVGCVGDDDVDADEGLDVSKSNILSNSKFEQEFLGTCRAMKFKYTHIFLYLFSHGIINICLG